MLVQREIVEQIGEIDVELIADRDDAGEADRALRRPIDHARRDRAGLRDQREIARAGMCAAKLALRLTPGIMTPRQLGPISRMPYLRAARSAASASEPASVAEAGADDERAGGAALARLVDDAGDCARRRRDDDEFGHERRLADDALPWPTPSISRMARIDEAELARKPALRMFLGSPRPTEPCRGLAPTSATERGDSRLFRR